MSQVPRPVPPGRSQRPAILPHALSLAKRGDGSLVES